jgi:hypothetical protein
MIIGLGRQNEGRIAIIELTGDGEHLLVAQHFRAEHNARWVTREKLPRERVDLKDLYGSRHDLLPSGVGPLVHARGAIVGKSLAGCTTLLQPPDFQAKYAPTLGWLSGLRRRMGRRTR